MKSKPRARILLPMRKFYPAQTGGPANSLYWMTRQIVRHDFEVDIVTTDEGIEEGTVERNRWLTRDFGNVVYCCAHRLLPLRLFRMGLPLIRRSDVVQLSSLFYPPSWIFAFFARLQGKAVVWSTRGELFPYALGVRSLRKKLLLPLIRMLPTKRFVFHATSEIESATIRRVFPKAKIKVIPNLLDLAAPRDEVVRERFLYLGRIHPIKAIDRLIDGFAKSDRFRASQYELVIVGRRDDASYADALEQQIRRLGLETQVKLLPPITGEEKERLLASSIATLLVSHSENFGNVIVESLAQGTPVVASRGTPWEEIDKEGVGFWCSNDPVDLATVIDRFLTMPGDEYAEMRRRACGFAARRFDVRRNIDLWIDFYDSLTGSTRPVPLPIGAKAVSPPRPADLPQVLSPHSHSGRPRAKVRAGDTETDERR